VPWRPVLKQVLPRRSLNSAADSHSRSAEVGIRLGRAVSHTTALPLVMLVLKRRQQVLKPRDSPDMVNTLKPSLSYERGQHRRNRVERRPDAFPIERLIAGRKAEDWGEVGGEREVVETLVSYHGSPLSAGGRIPMADRAAVASVCRARNHAGQHPSCSKATPL
jgi:hypothetical protein